MSNNIKEKKAAKLAAEKQQDIKLYRLMVEFTLAIVAVLLAIKAGNNEIFTLIYIMPPFLATTAVLFALSAVLYTVRRKNQIDESSNVITSALIFGNAASLFFVGALYYIYWDAELVIASLITLTVLYFAYNIYGGNFFMYSLISAIGFISLRITGCNSHFALIGNAGILVAHVFSFAIPIIAIVLAIILFAKDKNRTVLGITFGGKKCAVTFLISAAAILVGAVLTLVYPAALIFADFVLLGSYLIIAVICTVKMM